MPRGQESSYRALAHLLAAHFTATPKQAKEPILSIAKKQQQKSRIWELTNKLINFDANFEMVKKAISSEQDVDVFSDYYAMDEKLVFRIEIRRTNEEFFNLQENMISKEKAEQLIKLKDKGKSGKE